MRLGIVLHKWRVFEERSLRDVAKEMGVSAATLLRIEQGYDFDAKTMAKIWLWLSQQEGA